MTIPPPSVFSATARRTAALAVLSAAQFMIALDYSIVYIALPSIAGDLRLEPAVAQWVISAYAVLFAGFLLVGGRVADRVGAKRLFVVAILLFGTASAVGGCAADGIVLLAARGTQGFGASMLQPAILGLIGTTFSDGPSRSRALATWGSVGAAGLAAGTILGGLLTSVSWRLTFFINVPFAVLSALGALACFSRPRDRGPVGRAPVLSSALVTGAILALVTGLSLSADQGWESLPATIALGLACALMLAFALNEFRPKSVLIDRALRHTRSLGTGSAAAALYMASVGSEFYLLTLLLQSAKEYAPLQTGLALLPLAVIVTFGSMSAGRAVRRFGTPVVLIAGFGISAAGLGWLSATAAGGSYTMGLLPGLIISGFGHGVVYTSTFILGTHDVPARHQGTAGALLTTSQYVSAAVTVAALTLVLGPHPSDDSFRAAFLVTVSAAIAGMAAVAAHAVSRRRPG